MTAQAWRRAGLGMGAFGDIFGFVRVACRAVNRSGMLGMWIAFDIGVAIGTAQDAMHAGALLRSVDKYAVARLVLQIRLAMAGKALRVFLRPRWRGREAHKNWNRQNDGCPSPSAEHGAKQPSFNSPAMVHFIPSSPRTFGLCSPTAMRLWQTSQSFGMVLPSADTWLPSWQRKQPGQFICPKLSG